MKTRVVRHPNMEARCRGHFHGRQTYARPRIGNYGSTSLSVQWKDKRKVSRSLIHSIGRLSSDLVITDGKNGRRSNWG